MRGRRITPLLDYRRIVDALADAVIVADTGGQIVYANPAAGRLLGHDALEGLPLVDIVPERLRPAHQAAFDAYVATPERGLRPSVYTVPARRSDGADVLVELTLNPAASGEGDLLVAASLRDLSRS